MPSCIYWLIYYVMLLSLCGLTLCWACMDVLIIITALMAARLPAYVLLNCDLVLHCNVPFLATCGQTFKKGHMNEQ